MAVDQGGTPIRPVSYCTAFVRRCAAAVAALAVTAMVAAPAAAGNPPLPANCEVANALYCDHPIEADGSWIRCFRTQPFFMSRGRFIPAVQRCDRARPDAIPVGPPYHINRS